jgi:hypothetical protein
VVSRYLLDNTRENCWREKDLIVSETGNGSWNDFISSMKHNFDDPCNTFAQIVMIILVARLFWLGFQEDWTR